MTKEEFNEEKYNIERECDNQLRELDRRYAIANNTFNIGDIIREKNSGFRIRIEKIRIQRSGYNTWPTLIFSGPKLTKNLEPFKSGDRESIWQDYAEKI